MGTERAHVHVEDAEGGCPTLPDVVRQHLGGLLAAAYAETGSGGLERFADLLTRLEATLDDASRRDAAEFRSQLLAASPALRRFAITLARDASAADDLVQETLLRAWRNRTRFRMGTNFEAWTFTILRNQFFTGRRKAREVADEDGALAARLASPPEQDGRVDLADVQAALARLAAPMHEALMLVAVENMSYEDAAAVIGCEVGTVKSRVSRARERLSRLLGFGGGEVGGGALMLSAMSGGGPVRRTSAVQER